MWDLQVLNTNKKINRGWKPTFFNPLLILLHSLSLVLQTPLRDLLGFPGSRHLEGDLSIRGLLGRVLEEIPVGAQGQHSAEGEAE